MLRNSNDDVRFNFGENPLPEASQDDDPFACEDEKLLQEKPDIVEINRTGISEILSHKKLQNEIKRVIHILAAAQQSVPDVKAANSHQYHQQVVLYIGAGLLAVAAPSLFTGLMWGQIIRSLESVIANLVTAISNYTAAAADCKSGAVIHEQLLMTNARNLHEILKPVLEKWWNFSANGEDCMGFTSKHEGFIREAIATPNVYEFSDKYWCIDAIGYGTKGDQMICHAAVKEGCALVSQHAEEASAILQQFHDLDSKNHLCRSLEDKLQSLRFNLDHISFSDRINLTNALIAGGITVGAAVVIGLLFWARKHSKNALMNRNNDADKFVSMISNTDDANTVINSCVRLNIPFDPDMSISSLMQIYIGFNAQIESLWQHRIAFLSGAKDPNSNLFAFFKAGGKGSAQIILHHAGLGPQSIRL